MVLLEEEKVVQGERGTYLHKYLAKLSPLSNLDYRAWLFGQPHSLNKDKLLELALFTFLPEERSIVYHQMENDSDTFQFLLNAPLLKMPSALFTNSWYTFLHPGHFYVDFAHPHHFGGSFRSWGNAQEEILFYEFPKLAHLAYATEGNPIHATKESMPTPFLIPNVKRQTSIADLYGPALEKATLEEISSKVVYIPQPPPVHMLGMAAIQWTGEKQRYAKGDLEYLFRAAFLAFDGAKMITPQGKAVIHTGAWGCGIFRNSEKTITLIQLLAAALAEVDIIFEKIEESLLEEAKVLLSNKKNAHDVFETILKLQEKDSSWAPKSSALI